MYFVISCSTINEDIKISANILFNNLSNIDGAIMIISIFFCVSFHLLLLHRSNVLTKKLALLMWLKKMIRDAFYLELTPRISVFF